MPDKTDIKDDFAFKRETMLEFVQIEDGSLVLREVNAKEGDDEPLVTINFSDKVKEMLDGDAQYIGQHMINAAIQAFMQRQMSQWHAHVYDKEPKLYS